jgi:hypothetical protein
MCLLLTVGCSSGGSTGDPPGGTGGSETGGSASGGNQSTGGARTGGAGGTGGSNATGGANASGGTGGSSTAGAGGSTGGKSGGTGGAGDPCASLTCGPDQTCTNGACACKSGMLCTGSCVDTQNDASNCGGCGMKCGADSACVDGTCSAPMCNPDTQVRNGHVTHYTLATAMVACHYPTSSLPQYYGAMNEYDWQDSAVCGACVEITNGGNKLVLQIADECPYKGNEQWCKPNSHHIDLNNASNDKLGAGSNPAVTWKFVPCTPAGDGFVHYYFDKATKQYYLAVTPMNSRNVVKKMEVKLDGKWTAMPHTSYNTYELSGTDYGTGALTFRVTDIYNHVILETMTPAADKIVNGTKQFAACP